MEVGRRVSVFKRSCKVAPRLKWETRLEVERLLMGTPGVRDRQEAQEVEAALLAAGGDSCSYIDAATRTIGKLMLGPVPSAREVPFLPDDGLLRGTRIKTEYDARREEANVRDRELGAITDEFSMSSSSRFSSACPRCGARGDDIQEIDAQTRAADEGASVLGLCFKCGFRWKS